MTKDMHGIEYSLPIVLLLQDTGIGVAEIAARTCYDSFDLSENDEVPVLNALANSEEPNEFILKQALDSVNDTEHSNLLDDLAWTYFHHSILEHANLSFLVRGTSRGVLQEHARHRIQAISVRSTRYTMSGVINAYVASINNNNYMTLHAAELFTRLVKELDLFVTTGDVYNDIEINNIYTKLNYQFSMLGEEAFIATAVAKSSIPLLDKYLNRDLFDALQDGKKKRNVGDAFKHIVTDNWKVDMVVTFNVRSLKNYFTLRDSGAAYFQIRWLAQLMKEATPSKYLDLIVKS